MFDEIAKAKDIFWGEFQGTGMSHEIFDVLFDSVIEKLKRNLTSQSSGRFDPCANDYHLQQILNGSTFCHRCGDKLRR